MQTFSEYLSLRDSKRADLDLRPESNSDLYIDLDKLLPDVSGRLQQTAPKLIVYGDFGTGKSHLLRHIEKQIAPAMRYAPIYVELSRFERRSTFLRVHTCVMVALQGRLTQLLRDPAGRTWLKGAELNPDVRKALEQLADPNLSEQSIATLRSWIQGTGPTPTQSKKLGLSDPLRAWAGAADYVGIWRTVGNLQNAVDSRMLMLLFDEGESLQRAVSPEGIQDIGTGFRYFLDPDTKSIAGVFGLYMPRMSAHPFLRNDVLSRATGLAVQLKPLATAERAREFTAELWSYLSVKPLFLSEPALNYVTRNLSHLRDVLQLALVDGTRQHPTQRDLIRVLDRIALEAFNRTAKLPLRLDELREWFKLPDPAAP